VILCASDKCICTAGEYNNIMVSMLHLVEQE